MRLAIAAAALIATSACATTDGGDGTGLDSAYSCNADAVQDLIGREPTSELGADALIRSNSRALRWIRPGDAVTMDFRQDRLNINIGANGRIERINCG